MLNPRPNTRRPKSTRLGLGPRGDDWGAWASEARSHLPAECWRSRSMSRDPTRLDDAPVFPFRQLVVRLSQPCSLCPPSGAHSALPCASSHRAHRTPLGSHVWKKDSSLEESTSKSDRSLTMCSLPAMRVLFMTCGPTRQVSVRAVLLARPGPRGNRTLQAQYCPVLM